MKDLIFITAHCPNEEQVTMLEKCIDSVVDLNQHVLLISHTHVPPHIQKKCNYYFYDYCNDVNWDDDLLFFVRYVIDSKTTIRSKYFTKEFYGFSIYRMFTIASRIAENFGYKNIHHIEYDCVLKDSNLIPEHNKLLEKYNAVFYTNDGEKDGFLLGSFKSFKVSTLPELFKNYDKNKIRDMMVNVPLLPLETFTKYIFNQSGNVLFLNSTELKNNGRFFQNESPLRLKYFTPYFDHRSNSFLLFYKNVGENRDLLRVYINGESYTNYLIEPNHWRIIPMCGYDKLSSLLIISNDKIVYDKTFSRETRETLKTNAYLILNEEDN